jgi:hypothetical protein
MTASRYCCGLIPLSTMPWPSGRPMNSAASMPTSSCCCAEPSTGRDECPRKLDRYPSGAGHPPLDPTAPSCHLWRRSGSGPGLKHLIGDQLLGLAPVRVRPPDWHSDSSLMLPKAVGSFESHELIGLISSHQPERHQSADCRPLAPSRNRHSRLRRVAIGGQLNDHRHTGVKYHVDHHYLIADRIEVRHPTGPCSSLGPVVSDGSAN